MCCVEERLLIQVCCWSVVVENALGDSGWSSAQWGSSNPYNAAKASEQGFAPADTELGTAYAQWLGLKRCIKAFSKRP